MRLALLGGSFNPVHVGHLGVAGEVSRSLGYERVIFVPASSPVHKSFEADAGAAHRLAMLRIAVRGRPELGVDDCELRRGGDSYTIDTVRELLARYRVDGKPGLIIGDDLIGEFRSWKEAGALAALVDLIVARRHGSGQGTSEFPCRFVDNAVHAVSSSEIRRRLREGLSVRGLVPEGVRKYIQRHGLYA